MVSENYSVELYPANKNSSDIFSFAVILMAVFLNQSSVMLGVNFSFSDILCALTLILLNKQIKLPRLPLLFFILLTIHTLFTTFFIVPTTFMYFPKVSSVIISYIKLAATFLYFIIGYSLTNVKQQGAILKYYSLFAFIIGVVGSTAAVLKISWIAPIFISDGIRLKGLMNDPNYFSILQVSALAYFCRIQSIGKGKKAFIILLLVVSILASGSKTGLITLMAYILYRAASGLFKMELQRSTLYTAILLSLVFIVFAFNATEVIQKATDFLYTTIPSFYRIHAIFTDFNAAVSGMGSGRDVTWRVAANIALQSPLFGIGLGTYFGVADLLYGTKVIAHNSYLQLSCEWGVVLTGLLFFYIFFLIVKTLFFKIPQGSLTGILRDMIIIFLIGSLAISLNNARMFWLFLGMFATNLVQTQVEYQK